jgi:integrase/recombinase XerD
MACPYRQRRDEVQQLAGHADPRTTRLYDRRQKKVPRNIVERISI